MLDNLKEILAASASGQIGSHLVEILREKGADFVAGITRPEKTIKGVE